MAYTALTDAVVFGFTRKRRFSFSLVLLCLASGNIKYVRECFVGKRAVEYYLETCRPPIPPELEQASPGLAQLIKDMWQGDFRARPSFRDVVASLEACSSLGHYDYGEVPAVAPRHLARADSTGRQWGNSGATEADIRVLLSRFRAVTGSELEATSRLAAHSEFRAMKGTSLPKHQEIHKYLWGI